MLSLCWWLTVRPYFHRGMAQMRKLACDSIRTNSRGELQVPVASARQEILTSLVSALDSVVSRRLPQDTWPGERAGCGWGQMSKRWLLLHSAWRCPSSTPRWRASPSTRTAWLRWARRRAACSSTPGGRSRLTSTSSAVRLAFIPVQKLFCAVWSYLLIDLFIKRITAAICTFAEI